VTLLFNAAFGLLTEAQAGQSGEQNLPLPLVTRTRSAEEYIFDRPSIVLIARIVERCESEETDMEGQSLPGAETKARFWTSVNARAVQVLRVNDRPSDEPDLRYGYFLLEQQDRGEQPIRLEFARRYVFLLKPSPGLFSHWVPARDSADHLPPYALAIPQGGFEIVAGRLRPLVKGGPLDAYDGWLLSDLIKELRARE